MSSNIVGWIMLAIAILSNFAILVKMYVKVTEFEQWKIKVDQHLSDLERHIDPKRDGERHTELMRRMDRFEKKLDNLVAVESQLNSKLRRGDSEDA